jgi:hypothetical protein
VRRYLGLDWVQGEGRRGDSEMHFGGIPHKTYLGLNLIKTHNVRLGCVCVCVCVFVCVCVCVSTGV